MSSDCIFCKISNKEIKSDILYEDNSCVAFRDINPQAPTHILIIPKRHIEKISDITEQEKGVVGHLHWIAVKLAKGSNLSDFRLVFNNGQGAGQAVWHIHLHLLAGRPFSWPPG